MRRWGWRRTYKCSGADYAPTATQVAVSVHRGEHLSEAVAGCEANHLASCASVTDLATNASCLQLGYCVYAPACTSVTDLATNEGCLQLGYCAYAAAAADGLAAASCTP